MWHVATHTHAHTHARTHARTHAHTHTHTHTHTHRAVGSHICCSTQGAVGGSVPCSRAPQSWYWRWRECWLFTPHTYNPCQTWDSNPQPLDNKSVSLSIRPRLPFEYMSQAGLTALILSINILVPAPQAIIANLKLVPYWYLNILVLAVFIFSRVEMVLLKTWGITTCHHMFKLKKMMS